MRDDAAPTVIGSRLAAALASVVVCCSMVLAGCAGSGSTATPNALGPGPARAAAGAKSSSAKLDLSSAEAFTTSVAARVSQDVATARVVEALTLDVEVAGRELRVQLDRIWGFCSQAPEADCSSEVDALIQALHEQENDEAPKPDDLVAALRTVQYVQGMSKFAAGVLVEPFAGELVVVCMLDQTHRARLTMQSDLETLGLDRDAVFRRANENVRARLGRIEELVASTPAETVGVVTRGEFYESSQLLDTAGWAKLSRTRAGSLIVAVPSVDVLIFTWTSDAAVTEPLRSMVKDLAGKSARPLSEQLLRFSNGTWSPI